jgi:hypothetical protein
LPENADGDYARHAGCVVSKRRAAHIVCAPFAPGAASLLRVFLEPNMATIPGRSGRRRRVLNEEVLSASASHVALLAASDADRCDDAPRYGEAAAIEYHLQISDFVPRRHRSIALLVSAGLFTTSLVAALNQFAAPLAAAAGVRTSSLSIAGGRGLAAWISSVVLLFTGLTCVLVLSIRRHRIDDIRGRFRIWRWAALACLVASANCVTAGHALVADVATHFTGWSMLRDGAAWWLCLAGAPLAWIAARTLFDVAECRLAALLLLTAGGCYFAALASFLGWIPGLDAVWAPVLTGSAALFGHWCLLSASVTYARHVVLDAQGLIAARKLSERGRKADAKEDRKTDASVPLKVADTTRPAAATTLRVHDAPATTGRPTFTVTPARSPAKSSDWVDGSRRERDHYDNFEDADEDDPNGDRKLSKAERKQLRKLKARNRAA